jgi:outer membrane immunogenic protein
MKKLLLASVGIAVLALSGAASAADLSRPGPVYKAAAPAEAIFNWTGFYIGAHVGYGWGSKDWDQTFTSGAFLLDRSVSSNKPEGFLGGGQIGVNWQTGQWVLGLEADGSWTDANDCGVGHFRFPAYNGCDQVNWYATATARVGVAMDRALFYVKGGAAFAGEEHNLTFTNPAGVRTVTTDTPSDTRFGWTAGAGIEYAVAPNWSVKAEYNFMDFGTQNYTFNYAANPAGLVERWDISQQVHIAKVGINYRFGPSAVVARY